VHHETERTTESTKHSESLLDRYAIFGQPSGKPATEQPKQTTKPIQEDLTARSECGPLHPDLAAPTTSESLVQNAQAFAPTKPPSHQKEVSASLPRRKPEKLCNQPISKQPQTQKSRVSTPSELLGLFFGFYHLPSAEPEADRATTSAIRCLIGEGNNQSLVIKLLKERKPIEIENFFTRSNFVWTQKQVKKFDPLSVSRLEKCSFLKRLTRSDPQCQSTVPFCAANLEALVEEFAALKLFRVASLALLEGTLRDLLDRDARLVAVSDKTQLAVGNHIRGLKHISRKVLLATTVTERCRELAVDETEFIPKTCIVRGDKLEEDLSLVCKHFGFDSAQPLDPLIVKPGEFSNRGNGILMAYTASELRSAVSKVLQYRKSTESAVVQSYLSKPLLFKDRKFDIRCFALVTKFFHSLHFFWYLDGYARTSSFSYDSSIRDNLKVHLTNEAVQVKGRPV